jgi:hypothetical protein
LVVSQVTQQTLYPAAEAVGLVASQRADLRRVIPFPYQYDLAM